MRLHFPDSLAFSTRGRLAWPARTMCLQVTR
jgi:hypothetical protein